MDDTNNNKENVLDVHIYPQVKQGESSSKVNHFTAPTMTFKVDDRVITHPYKTNPMIVDKTDSNIGAKRRFLSQQLMLLLHARKCCKNGPRTQPSRCNTLGCQTYKDLYNHISNCQTGNMCTVLNCSISRLLLSHFDNCSKQNCALCVPLRSQSGGNVSLVQASSGSIQQGQGLPDGVNPLLGKQDKAQVMLQLPGVQTPIRLQSHSPDAHFEAVKKAFKSVENVRAKEVNLKLREERLRIREKVLEVRTKDLNKQKLELDKQEFDLTVAQVDLWHREGLIQDREETLRNNGNLNKAKEETMRKNGNQGISREQVVDLKTAEIVARRISSNFKLSVKGTQALPAKRQIQRSEENLSRKRTSTTCLLNITNGNVYPLKASSLDPFLPQFE